MFPKILIASRGLNLRKTEFSMAGRYRLGMQVFRAEVECPTHQCMSLSDSLGDHSLVCNLGGR